MDEVFFVQWDGHGAAHSYPLALEQNIWRDLDHYTHEMWPTAKHLVVLKGTMLNDVLQSICLTKTRNQMDTQPYVLLVDKVTRAVHRIALPNNTFVDHFLAEYTEEDQLITLYCLDFGLTDYVDAIDVHPTIFGDTAHPSYYGLPNLWNQLSASGAIVRVRIRTQDYTLYDCTTAPVAPGLRSLHHPTFHAHNIADRVIKHLWFVTAGSDVRCVKQTFYDAHRDNPRCLPLAELRNMPPTPGGIYRVTTDPFRVDSCFPLPIGTSAKTLCWCPPHYVVACVSSDDGDALWIFDDEHPADIGPVCRITHPQIRFKDVMGHGTYVAADHSTEALKGIVSFRSWLNHSALTAEERAVLVSVLAKQAGMFTVS
jgi:hypothetical protein